MPEPREQLTRDELIDLVEQLMHGQRETEQETSDLFFRIEQSVVDPQISDYMFYWNQCGWDSEPTAEQVVDRALAYKPIVL